MDLLASVIRHGIAPLWAHWERSSYLRHCRWLRRTQFDPPEVILKRQQQAIGQLLAHAYGTVPFWRQRMDEAEIRPGAQLSWEDFGRLPVLTKGKLREQGERLLSEHFRSHDLHRKKTSGSTGVSVVVYVDDHAQQFKRACTLRSDEWSGWRLGESVAKVWGNPEYLSRGWRGRVRNALLDRSRYLDTLDMDEAAMERFARSFCRRPPSLLFGHAHSLYLLAEFVRSRPALQFHPRAIISTAMVLHAWERKSIEEVFGCPVTNRYGCEEVSLIASQCECHEGLHVNADGVYVEVLAPDGKPAAPGEPGAVVVTDLVNRAMPMLRYKVGDVAVAAHGGCACGRGLPLIDRIEGRAADYVVTPAGRLISGISLTENFAVLVPGIAQLQIVQQDVHRLIFRIVRGPDFGEESLERIGALVEERFGESVRHTCQYVERIEPEPSGKYRFCISHVANPFLSPASTVCP